MSTNWVKIWRRNEKEKGEKSLKPYQVSYLLNVILDFPGFNYYIAADLLQKYNSVRTEGDKNLNYDNKINSLKKINHFTETRSANKSPADEDYKQRQVNSMLIYRINKKRMKSSK